MSDAASDLAARRCTPLDGQPPMDADEIAARLAAAPGWQLVGGAIEKRWDFVDFHRTMAFANAVAWIAHEQDHHPDLLLSYGRCTLRFSTHSVGGISINDFICAARVDALLRP